MFKITTNNIKDFPFEDYSDIHTRDELDEVANYHQLWNYQTWMMPQILAHFGRWQVQEPKWRLVCQQNIATRWDQGLWRVATQINRGQLVKPQNKMPKYGALTPLVLAGIKEQQGILYSSWDIEPGFALMEPQLLDSILQPCPTPTTSELLLLRESVLVYKSGARRGQRKSAEATWSCGELRGTTLWGTTALQKVMLLQVWLAHPQLRHPLMILDPNNWDQQPPPLVSTEVLVPTTKQVQLQQLPWLNP